jgi:uncharacterized protein (TIGR01777 family)
MNRKGKPVQASLFFVFFAPVRHEPTVLQSCFKSMRKIVIAGASGFIGNRMTAYFKEMGWTVKTIGRAEAHATWNDQPSLIRALEDAHAVVNLAGKSVNCRFTASNVEALVASRVDTTRAIGDAIALCKNPPPVWVNASGASIYREIVMKANTENSPSDGQGTMADVARKWEQALQQCITPRTKKVALRISLVLGQGGGVYPTFKTLVRLLQGGAQGSGKQMMSWIHIDDLVQLVNAIISSENPPQIVNAAAPHPLSNKDFMQCFRESLGVSIGIPAPAVFIRLGTSVLGVDSELVLRGMNVVSENAEQIHFVFQYPKLADALNQLAKH